MLQSLSFAFRSVKGGTLTRSGRGPQTQQASQSIRPPNSFNRPTKSSQGLPKLFQKKRYLKRGSFEGLNVRILSASENRFFKSSLRSYATQPENGSNKPDNNEQKKRDIFEQLGLNKKTDGEVLNEVREASKKILEAQQKYLSDLSPFNRMNDSSSVFNEYKRPQNAPEDGTREFFGMSPRQEFISNPETLRNAEDLKLRRNMVIRKTLWYSISELLFDPKRWRHMANNSRLLLLYLILTAGLLGFVALRPSSEDYDFYGKRRHEEEMEKIKAGSLESANQKDVQWNTESLYAQFFEPMLNSVKDIASNFSPFEPLKKIAYTLGGGLVMFRMIHAYYKGDPLSEDERMIAAQTPISLAEDLRPDEYHHVSSLLRIMATGHIPGEPWSALIPPSPWAPHLTLVIDVDLLYTLGFDHQGRRVLRKRPFADYLLSALGDSAEIILASSEHSKTTAKHFFKLFDPFGVTSHTFTAEDHRWNGAHWLKPLEPRFIGRKPERMVVLDKDFSTCGEMCANVLRIAPWSGKHTDTTLLELVPVLKYMAAGIEEGIDVRTVITKYEGSKSAKDIIREQVSFTGQEIPNYDPLDAKLRAKYSQELVEPIVLTEQEWNETVERVNSSRTASPIFS